MEAKIDVKSTIEAMEIGEEQQFPIESLSNVRSHASNSGLRLGRKYKTSTDRDNRKIVVVREL